MTSKTVSIIIHGFGRVGKLLKQEIDEEEVAKIASIIDATDKTADYKNIQSASLENTDVIIDFSHKEAPLAIVEKVISTNPKVAIVIGTTGWEEDKSKIKKLVEKNNLRFLYSPNFAIGTLLFFKIIEYATSLIDAFSPSYRFDSAVLDIHHRQKKDIPSGTAKRIAEVILEKSNAKNKIVYDVQNREIADDELHVASLRSGTNVGYHKVIFDAAGEYIELAHQAKNREIFAKGALLATYWLLNKKPGYYTFEDYIEEKIKSVKNKK